MVRRRGPPWRLRPPDDPGLEALRRAARVALVMPAASGMGLPVVRNALFSTFIAFGSFSLLALADFGGLRRPRAIAYASATIEEPHEMGYSAGPTLDGVDALYVQREILTAGLEQLASLLDGHGDPDSSSTIERVSHEVLRDSALRCLRQWADDPSVERPAVAAVVAAEWMDLLDSLVGHLEDPVAEAARAARVPGPR